MKIHRFFVYNQSSNQAGKVLTDAQMEAFHNHTFEGDDYPDGVVLYDGTAQELTAWVAKSLEIQSHCSGSNARYREKVARNVLNAVLATPYNER